MMNEKFDAQLRQHLLGSANERPAEGQLESVIDGVATTRQRVPLVARLTWTPGRIGPVPTSAIRYGLVAVALALAMIAGALLAGGGSSRPTTVFEGTWTAIDPLDRSGMTFVVGPGRAPAIYFEDGYASGGACVDDEVKRFTARGTGAIREDRLLADYPKGGGCGLITVAVFGFYDYVARTDMLVDQDGLGWSRALSAVVPPSEPPAPTRDPQARTFASAVHGFSIDYPAGWESRPASEPWSSEELSFDSPAADVLFDPRFGDGLYLLVASEAYGGLSADEWWAMTMDRLCADSGGSVGSAEVDGADALAFSCGRVQNAVLVMPEDRGYLFTLHASPDQPGLVGTYDWDWLKVQIKTIDLFPEGAVEGPQPTAACREFRAAGTYSAEAKLEGRTVVSVDVPATAEQPWHGLPYEFSLRRAPCLGGGASLEAIQVFYVPADACNPDEGIEAETYDAAIQALTTQTGHDPISPATTTIGGHRAQTFTITAPTSAASPCVGRGLALFDGVVLDPGETVTISVVEVDGWALALTVRGDGDGSLASEFEGIIASMRIGE